MPLKGDNKTALVTCCGGGFVVEWEKTVTITEDASFSTPYDEQERGSEVFKSWLDAAAFMRNFFVEPRDFEKAANEALGVKPEKME